MPSLDYHEARPMKKDSTSLGAEKLAKCEKFGDSSSEHSRKFEVFPLVCKLAMIQVYLSKKIQKKFECNFKLKQVPYFLEWFSPFNL